MLEFAFCTQVSQVSECNFVCMFVGVADSNRFHQTGVCCVNNIPDQSNCLAEFLVAVRTHK